jgi:hypothetical protein
MSNFIQNPISHPEWNPQMGDFFNQRVFEEDRQYEKKQLRKKIMVSSLLSIHLAMLVVIFFYFA